MKFGKKPVNNLVTDAKEARKRASMFISKEITEVLTLISGLAERGKTSVCITKELEGDTIENLKIKNFTVERLIGTNGEKYKIKW